MEGRKRKKGYQSWEQYQKGVKICENCFSFFFFRKKSKILLMTGLFFFCQDTEKKRFAFWMQNTKRTRKPVGRNWGEEEEEEEKEEGKKKFFFFSSLFCSRPRLSFLKSLTISN